jgi:DNA-binding CsgD family transcriptional regulator
MAWTTAAPTPLDDRTAERRDRVNPGRFLHVVPPPTSKRPPSITGPPRPARKPEWTMTFSRTCLELELLLEQVRCGRGGSLVLIGQRGVGKTALMEQAVTTVRDVRFVRVLGVQAEKHTPFAAIQQLCGQLDHVLERLPDPQALALKAAFGIRGTTQPNQLLVGLAVHTLLVEAAEQQPVVGLVDDAESLDKASAWTLAFVARRLASAPAALVFALPEPSDDLAGLPAVQIDGLSYLEARSLVEAQIPGPLDDEVRTRIVSETEGQPLSIVKVMSSVRLATVGSVFGPCPTPLPEALEVSFRQRLEQLPDETRLLLLVAAAEPLGRPSLLWGAADVLGIDIRAARRAEADGLLRLSAPIQFCHPLLRSAIYQAAPLVERRRAHQALAEATNAATDPDLHIWHRSQAATVPHEGLARELENSARRAQHNGGWAAVAALLEQAAALSADPARRGDRLLAAAEARLAAGELRGVQDLLAKVEARLLDKRDGARLERLWAEVMVVERQDSNALHLLLNSAKRLEPLDPRSARKTYLRAFDVAIDAGCVTDNTAVAEAVHWAQTRPASPEPTPGADILLEGFAALVRDGYGEAVPVLKRAIRSFDGQQEHTWLSLGAETTLNLWDDHAASSLASRHRELSLRAGALLDHQRSMTTLATLSILDGDFAGAANLIEQTRLLTHASVAGSLRVPLMLAAFRGQEVETEALIESTTDQATLHGGERLVAFAETMAAVLHNGLGHYRKAFVAARRAADYCDLGMSDWALVELVEAAVRCGEWEDGLAAFKRLSERTRLSGTEWALGVEAYSHALLSDEEAAEEFYRTAIDLLGRCSISTALARAHLVYGEWLRRARRRLEARQQLRKALQMFTTMGAEAFAERAERELLATGERVQKRGAKSDTQLTPQEFRISQLARDGHSNPDIAAKLYISPRTVEYHLRKVFRKLGISSRNELGRVLLATSVS